MDKEAILTEFREILNGISTDILDDYTQTVIFGNLIQILNAHMQEDETYGQLADEIERRILAMFDNEEPYKFYDDVVVPFLRGQLGSKKAVRRQPLPAPPEEGE